MKIIILIVALLIITVGGFMVFQPVSTDNSNASNLNQVNNLAKQVQSSERTQIFKDDAGTRRVLLGKGLNDFYGLRVSPAGTDVYDAANSDLVFNSDQNVFKIVGTGSEVSPALTVNAPGGGGWASGVSSLTINHGLSYTPAVIGFIETSSSYSLMPFQETTAVSSTKMQIEVTSIITNATQVIITTNGLIDAPFGNSFNFGGYNVKYYLLQESAS